MSEIKQKGAPASACSRAGKCPCCSPGAAAARFAQPVGIAAIKPSSKHRAWGTETWPRSTAGGRGVPKAGGTPKIMPSPPTSPPSCCPADSECPPVLPAPFSGRIYFSAVQNTRETAPNCCHRSQRAGEGREWKKHPTSPGCPARGWMWPSHCAAGRRAVARGAAQSCPGDGEQTGTLRARGRGGDPVGTGRCWWVTPFGV